MKDLEIKNMDTSQRKDSIELVIAGFLVLFLELAVMRWLPSNIFSLAYFSNIVLISSFLGLGFGFLFSQKKLNLFNWFPVALLIYISIVLFLRGVETIVPETSSEMMWSFYSGNEMSKGWLTLGMIPTLSIVFFLNAVLFSFLGEKIADLMRKFRPIKAYTLDILGSIMGVVFFTTLSFCGSSFSNPTVWFAVSGVASLFLLFQRKVFFAVGMITILLGLFLVHSFSKNEIWSPYYSIKTEIEDGNGGVSIYVNRFFFQRGLNFDQYLESKQKYELPYLLKDPESVLILGAGSGNDVSIANFHNVPKIDAVEIDKEIYELGKKYHPNKPYHNSNVTVYIDDARSFLKKSENKYDMIVVGTLDSHALLSSKSTVRLDNFVYTQESLRGMTENLTPEGVVVLMFSVPKDWLGQKLIKSVQAVFGADNTLVFAGDPSLFNLMIISGPGVPKILSAHHDKTIKSKPVPDSVLDKKVISTDDWPYLYLREHKISSYYLEAILIILLLSSFAFYYLYRENKKFYLEYSNFGFFALGAGFLLLETKSITTLSLLFGSTWIVGAFTFIGILLMILFANILISKYEIKNQILIYCLLIFTLLLNFFIPVSYFSGMSFWIKAFVPTLITALPIFFASLIFSINWKKVTNIETSYGMNLIGAVFGGFLEYLSMITGLNFLYILAIAVYLISIYFFIVKNNKPA